MYAIFPQGMKPRKRKAGPTDSSYWVLVGSVLAGEYPRAWSRFQLKAKLRRLLGAGVTYFLDLTEEDEKGLESYVPLLQEQAARLGTPVVYRRFPIPDFAVPEVAQVRLVLDEMSAALAAGQGLYVHCFAGLGRTGVILGCYLVRRGYSGPEALRLLARVREGTRFDGLPSPITPEQRQMVLDWATLDTSPAPPGTPPPAP
jgi:protein-tyrosine phosphatase